MCEDEQDNEKGEIEKGELKHVFEGFFRVVLDIFAEGYKACKGCYESSDSADIDTDEQGLIILCELLKQNRRGDIAYDLAGECAEEQGI